MVVIIDNYDSFAYNLVQLVGKVSKEEIMVIRNDSMSVLEIESLFPSHIIISPGPGRPMDAGISEELILHMKTKCPILGVCLGHQGIGEVFGEIVTYAKEIVHGKKSVMVVDNNHPIFYGLPSEFMVGRYHSLAIKNWSSMENEEHELIVIARAPDDEIMAVAHKEYDIIGIQFHPESFLTEYGIEIMNNFLHI